MDRVTGLGVFFYLWLPFCGANGCVLATWHCNVTIVSSSDVFIGMVLAT